jgi:DNA topoisomerase-1
VSSIDPETRREAAREAGLRFTTDARPGISRRRAGRGFSYRDPDGGTIRDTATLARIRSLAVPPAWTDVWISPDPRGHLQATGRDARGRKQSRYHPDYRATRERVKYDRMVAFAGLLPRIRERVDADLARQGLPREKVLAAVVRLLELTLIRVGNDEYARLNRSFGLTTLRDRHAHVRGSQVRFRFRGKSGVMQDVTIRDRRLARVVGRCQDLPGQELLQYVDDDGEIRDVGSEDVNAYLRDIAGEDVTAKDFRTWAGTVLAYRALMALQPGATEREARRSYVHPEVLAAYLDGSIGDALVAAAEEQAAPPQGTTPDEEAAVVSVLRERLDLDAARGAHRRRRESDARGRAADRPRAARKRGSADRGTMARKAR